MDTAKKEYTEDLRERDEFLLSLFKKYAVLIVKYTAYCFVPILPLWPRGTKNQYFNNLVVTSDVPENYS